MDTTKMHIYSYDSEKFESLIGVCILLLYG